MLGPVYVSSLLIYVFLLGELSPLILRDILKKQLVLPVFLLLELELCLCDYLLLGLLKDYFCGFSRVWFPSLC
jgi:Na+/pantothenate symporter